MSDKKLDLIMDMLVGFKTDLQEMRTDVRDLKVDVQDLKSDMETVKSDVQGLKTDVQGLKADMETVKSDVQGLKTDMSSVKKDLQQQGDLLHQLVKMTAENNKAYVKIMDELDTHEHSIGILHKNQLKLEIEMSKIKNK